jgi:cell division protein ZapB
MDTTMSNENLSALEHQIDQLIYHCTQLEKENATLRNRETAWVKERLNLVEKNDIARTKVEAMIDRLRALEAQT